MMHAINEMLLAVSGSLAASIVAKATIILTLGLIEAWLARASRAAVRHALLVASFGVLLLLPIAVLIAPPLRIAVHERIAPTSFAKTAGTILPVTLANAVVDPTPAISRWPSGTELLLAGWFAGIALFLLPVVTGLRRVYSLRRSGLRWAHGQSLADELAHAEGVRRRVEVRLSDPIKGNALTGPMTCGAVHPVIVLPHDAQTWNEDDLNRALVHELEHVRRGDWTSHCVARVLCAVYWFHPLVWIAWRKLELEAERSCDDAVLGQSEATAYADQLVALARRVSARSPSLAMASRADLGKRVSAVLDDGQKRGRAGRISVALTFAAAAVLVLTISPLRVVAAPQETGAGIRTALPRFTSTTMLVMVSATAAYQNGTPIDGLRSDDFEVTEDGRRQFLSVFEFAQSYYLLGYYTSNASEDGQYRKINVTLKGNSAAKLEYRNGYYAGRTWNLPTSGKAAANRVDPRTVDPNNAPPIPIFKAEPQYSEEARTRKWQGWALLNVDISASGLVTDVQVIQRLGLGLDGKAVEAVRQWRFKAATKEGKPVAAQAQVEVRFQLL